MPLFEYIVASSHVHEPPSEPPASGPNRSGPSLIYLFIFKFPISDKKNVPIRNIGFIGKNKVELCFTYFNSIRFTYYVIIFPFNKLTKFDEKCILFNKFISKSGRLFFEDFHVIDQTL